jgi:2-polyprenyl-6-methoxyphenol hydroxylase-like FAD-dependent oxidoreductase
MSSTEDEANVVIVGGGPCGLALAIGLRQLGYGRVVVVERCAEAVDDWSKAFCS